MSEILTGSRLGPTLFFGLAILVFLVLARSRWVTSRAGGAALGLAVPGLVIWALQDGEFRRRLAEPENLALLLFALLAVAVVWLGRRRARLDTTSRGTVVSHEAAWSATEIAAAGGAVLVALVLAFFRGAPLTPAFDPAAAPEELQAPFFLLALQEAGRHFSLGWSPDATGLSAGLVLLGLFAAGLWLFPTLDPPPAPDSGGERREALFVFLFAGYLLVLVPSLIGAFLRPEAATHAALENTAGTVASLGELLWSGWRGSVPGGWLWREAPGLLLLLLYFGLLPFLLLRWRPMRTILGRYRRRLASRSSFVVALGLFLVVLYVPASLALRAGLGVEALVALPELGLRL